jgi:hypothetical protein
MTGSLLAAIGHGDAAAAVWIVLLIVGVACLCGAAWRAYLRDPVGAIILLVVGVVLVLLAL